MNFNRNKNVCLDAFFIAELGVVFFIRVSFFKGLERLFTFVYRSIIIFNYVKAIMIDNYRTH